MSVQRAVQSSAPAVLESVTGVVAVVAHPDDESFGLGAVLAALTGRGVPVSVVCFTRGEASTLRDSPGDLAVIRADELRRAATVLGIDDVVLLDYADGELAKVGLGQLAAHVGAAITRHRPSHLVVFDLDGITGHPDHVRATEAALAAAADTADAAGVAVLAWALPQQVATALNAEFGTGFVGRDPAALDATVAVSRVRQWHAIECHRSQSSDNPVLHRRLQLQGDVEYLRWLQWPGGVGRRRYACRVGVDESGPPSAEVIPLGVL